LMFRTAIGLLLNSSIMEELSKMCQTQRALVGAKKLP
jgi:hypothetical protein